MLKKGSKQRTHRVALAAAGAGVTRVANVNVAVMYVERMLKDLADRPAPCMLQTAGVVLWGRAQGEHSHT